MENLMTLRGVRTWLLAAALGAACGGGDPPGDGNGNDDTDGGDDTTDGTTGNGGRMDGHVPNPNNPLIQVIPGTWEFYEEALGDMSSMPVLEPVVGLVIIDPNDQNCSGDGAPPRGPIGDACIHWMRGPEEKDGDEGGGLVGVWWLVLMDDRVIYDPYQDPMRSAEGRVLDGGQRIEYRQHHEERHYCPPPDECPLDPEDGPLKKDGWIPFDTTTDRFRKIR